MFPLPLTWKDGGASMLEEAQPFPETTWDHCGGGHGGPKIAPRRQILHKEWGSSKLPFSSPSSCPLASLLSMPTLEFLGFLSNNKANISLILQCAKLYVRHCGDAEINRLGLAPSSHSKQKFELPGWFTWKRSWVPGAPQILFSTSTQLVSKIFWY